MLLLSIDGYAPFGSLKPRNNSFLPSENTVLMAPGPGSYNLDKSSMVRGTRLYFLDSNICAISN